MGSLDGGWDHWDGGDRWWDGWDRGDGWDHRMVGGIAGITGMGGITERWVGSLGWTASLDDGWDHWDRWRHGDGWDHWMMDGIRGKDGIIGRWVG